MTPDFRALCEELLTDYEQNRFRVELAAEARTLLAQPVAVGPTDEELLELARPFSEEVGDGFTSMVDDEIGFARAVLAKWGANAQ